MEFYKYYYKEADCQMKYMMFGLPKAKIVFVCFRLFVRIIEGGLLQHCNLLGRPQGVYDLPMKMFWVLVSLHEQLLWPIIFLLCKLVASCFHLSSAPRSFS